MKYWLSKIAFTVIASVAILNVNSTYAEDRFSVTIGSKDQLVIFSPSGDKVAEFNPPAIAQPVKVGASTFQVSYGRDINDLWTVILAPTASSPTPLHFTTLANQVDSEKGGVVTLTYGKDLKTVTVDPGYIGVVKVNGARTTSPVAISNTPAPVKVAPAVTAPPRKEEVVVQTAPVPAPAPAAESPKEIVTPVATTTTTSTTVAETAPLPAAPPVVPQLNPKKTYWSEPVTPPNAKDLPSIATDEIKLLEVKGNVTVTMPNTTTEVPATSGMTIPSGATVKTGNDGSAAAYLGGVNSARLMPQTEGSINQTVANNKRETLIDLKNGVVFANVGRKPGETQDFKVKTPSGVAAAKGTAFVVKAQGNQLFVATLAGQTGVTDSNGNFIGNSTPTGSGSPGIVTNQPGSTAQGNQAILASILVVVNAFNDKVNALEAKDPATLTDAEKTYLAQAPQIADKVAELLNEALKKEGFKGDIPPQVQKLIDEGIVPTTPNLEGAQGGPGAGGTGDPGIPGNPGNWNDTLPFNPNQAINRTTPT
ncbi:MAG: hypothetical protein B9S32_12385 [Verrucomicrobia bacterium Tous-C9LFEB]|nr:MAG: hypothetical protein B9S32_12385 [Verrucomicrobia bacterium Tous-C9LFEB]